MIQLPSDIVAKDVSQWCHGGWFYAELDGQRELCTLMGAHPEGKYAEVYSLKAPTAVRKVTFDKIWVHWPMCGALNLMPDKAQEFEGKVACYLQRLQKKQWKRTYTQDCLKLKVLSDEDSKAYADFPAVVRAAFDPMYYTFTQAEQMLADGWQSVAITPSIAVQKGSKLRVFVDSEVIGLIGKGGYFTCINPGLKRKLIPYLDYKVV